MSHSPLQITEFFSVVVCILSVRACVRACVRTGLTMKTTHLGIDEAYLGQQTQLVPGCGVDRARTRHSLRTLALWNREQKPF